MKSVKNAEFWMVLVVAPIPDNKTKVSMVSPCFTKKMTKLLVKKAEGDKKCLSTASDSTTVTLVYDLKFKIAKSKTSAAVRMMKDADDLALEATHLNDELLQIEVATSASSKKVMKLIAKAKVPEL